MENNRRPTMEPFFVQKIPISRLLPLQFGCSEGHFNQFDLSLTNSHICQLIPPDGNDLFSLILTYFVSAIMFRGTCGVKLI